MSPVTTPEPLTETQIAELERLEKEATPGEWDVVCAPFAGTWHVGQIRDHQANPLRSKADAVLAVKARNALPSLLASVLVSRSAPAPAAREPIRWDCGTGYWGVEELNRRYGAGRFVAVGGPDTLYCKSADGKDRFRVPMGWWVCDVNGAPAFTPERPPAPAPGEVVGALREALRDFVDDYARLKSLAKTPADWERTRLHVLSDEPIPAMERARSALSRATTATTEAEGKE